MSAINTAVRFSEWAFEFVLVSPLCIIFAIAVVSLVGATGKQRPIKMGLWKRYHWLALTQLLFFPFAIGIGVSCAKPTADYFNAARHADRTALLCLNALCYSSFASVVFWIWRMKGFRWYATSLMTLIELPTLGALFVAGMSVAGDWL
jgi:hypothetical protein